MMWMPEGLEQRRYKDWNRLVRELMEVWETAHLLGKERWFQEQLEVCVEERELLDRLAELRSKLAMEGRRSGYNLAETGDGTSAVGGAGTMAPHAGRRG